MRKAINENPMVQMAVIAVVGIAFALILFMQLGKGGDSEAETSATSPTAAATTPPTTPTTDAPAAPATPSEPAPTTGAGAAPEAPSAAEVESADGLLPTKGLPEDLLLAYAKDKAIALLIIDPNGISDTTVRRYTKRLSARDNVEVFVVRVNNIGRYSRITAGVSVNRVPALVVIRPRKLTKSVPTASVSYGFRGGDSVEQALDDALYKGRTVNSYP